MLHSSRMLFMEKHVERWRQQDLLAGPPIQLHETRYYIQPS